MTLLAFFSLTTPLMLGGLALLALPIIAHLLNRHAQRRVVFPTIRFMRNAVASQSRLFRLRRWILLALRCLLVALIVLAFSRPVWISADASATGKNAASGVVVLLDASVSTGQRASGISCFQTLRGAASRTLDALTAAGDQANLVVATARPSVVFPHLTRNIPALREELGRLEPSFERADLLRSLGLAGESLNEFNGNRRLVIVSDLQQSNWDEVLQQSERSYLLPRRTRVTVLAPLGREVENVALSQPRYFPSQPIADQPLQLIVSATNYATHPKQVRTVLKVDGQSAGEQTITLTAGEQRDVAFDAVVSGKGDHLVEFSTTEDDLPADDHAYLVLKTILRLPVLVVSDDRPDEIGSAAYFLVRALAPHQSEHDRFEVRQVSTSQLNAKDLAAATAVFVGYVAEMSPQSASLFRQYVAEGGGVLFFCGEGAVDRNLQVLDGNVETSNLIPWKTGPVRSAGLLKQPLRITGGKWQSRLLADFDEQSQISLGQIHFQRTWTVGALRPAAEVLLTFSDGTPALGLQQHGLGQFVLANFSPAIETSDLAKYGSFVALVQSLAKQLRPSVESNKPVYVGEFSRHTEPISNDAKVGNISLLGPGRQASPFTTLADAGHLAFDIERTDRPGFYEFYRGEERVAVTAINVDPRESDLRRIDQAKLAKQLEAVTGTIAEAPQADGWSPLQPTGGRPVWGSCLAAAMCIVALELFLVGLWRR